MRVMLRLIDRSWHSQQRQVVDVGGARLEPSTKGLLDRPDGVVPRCNLAPLGLCGLVNVDSRRRNLCCVCKTDAAELSALHRFVALL